ncbi:hypothetical protein MMC21_006414 [Puttea exsequens]|nr:hypothetical protein [Puttea exsequens]
MDVKELAYFMKDWKADCERHVSLGFSVANIRGYGNSEQTLFITHGYGQMLPVRARQIYVRDESCFDLDWVETVENIPLEHSVNTAKLSAGVEGVSRQMLDEYLDAHLNSDFENFVQEYFEGTPFISDMLLTAFRFWKSEQTPVIKKSLKLLLAYNLTQHITMVEGMPDEECFLGRIDDTDSKFYGKTVAPVMINFEIKCAMAEMWRELQKDILDDLSALFQSIYSKEKLKNWPTIFMVCSILLAVWEEMQFDCHYRLQVGLLLAVILTVLTMDRTRIKSANFATIWKPYQLGLLLVSSRPSRPRFLPSTSGIPRSIISSWAPTAQCAQL